MNEDHNVVRCSKSCNENVNINNNDNIEEPLKRQEYKPIDELCQKQPRRVI